MDGKNKWDRERDFFQDRVSICQVSWVIDRGMMAEVGMNGERDGSRGVIDLRGQER